MTDAIKEVEKQEPQQQPEAEAPKDLKEKVKEAFSKLEPEVRIILLKGAFKSGIKKGLFQLIISLDSAQPFFSEVILTDEEQAIIPPPNLTFIEFRSVYNQFKSKYKLDNDNALILRQNLLQVFTDKNLIDEKGNIKNEEINNKIQEELKKVFAAELEFFQADSLLINKEEYENLKSYLEQEKEEEEKESKEETEQIILKTQVAIDPVKGKPFTELSQGDNLLVRIIDDRPVAEYLSKLLGCAQEDGIIKPVLVTAVRAEEQKSGNYKLIVKFGPGIFGEAIIPASVKLKYLLPQDIILPKSKTFLGMPVTITPMVLVEAIIIIVMLGVFLIYKITP